MNRRAAGFTLLELLVAMAIFAVVAALAYGGLMQVLNQREMAQAQTERWREVQLAIRTVTRDLQQLHPRPVRDELGDRHEPAVLARPGGEYALEVTRGGWTNPGGQPRSTLQRVAYRVEDGELLRVYWPVLDRTPGTAPVIAALLTGVDRLDLRLMDWQGEWHTQWPPAGNDPQASLQVMPRAVEFAVELDDMGRIWRLVESGP